MKPTVPETEVMVTPKTKKKATDAVVAKGGSPQPQQPPSALSLQVEGGINAEVWLRHRSNVEEVFNHALFSDAKDRDPIGINKGEGGESGVQAVFDLGSALCASEHLGAHKAGINLAWINPYFSTSSNVPIMWTSVE